MKGKMSKDKKVRRVFEYENCTQPSEQVLEYSLPSLVFISLKCLINKYACTTTNNVEKKMHVLELVIEYNIHIKTANFVINLSMTFHV